MEPKLSPVAEKKVKKKTPIQQRLLDTNERMLFNKGTVKDAIFQHSILCQTFLPYRNQGQETIWQRDEGNVSLAIQCSKIFNPETQGFEFVGLPYGAKARLILAHINSEAIRQQSSHVSVERSMTAFIKRMGMNVDGRTIKEVKNQLRRLLASEFNLGYTDVKYGGGGQVNLKIAKAFNLWFPKDERQRIIWSSDIQLTDDYFNSLMDHAIPLDERALSALSHNAMALDIYAWLVQRLHRIDRTKAQFVDWNSLHKQFGRGYAHMYKFKQIYRRTLTMVLTQYPQARIVEEKNKGFWLRNSPPPIDKKTILSLC